MKYDQFLTTSEIQDRLMREVQVQAEWAGHIWVVSPILQKLSWFRLSRPKAGVQEVEGYKLRFARVTGNQEEDKAPEFEEVPALHTLVHAVYTVNFDETVMLSCLLAGNHLYRTSDPWSGPIAYLDKDSRWQGSLGDVRLFPVAL